MILTFKALEDFEEWRGEKHLDNFEFDNFYFLSTTSQQAMIIDWLDTVGIYVTVKVVIEYEDYRVFKGNADDYETTWYVTRQEATKAAIQKANSIYNSRKNDK